MSLNQLLYEDDKQKPGLFQRFKNYYTTTNSKTGERKLNKKRLAITAAGVGNVAVALAGAKLAHKSIKKLNKRMDNHDRKAMNTHIDIVELRQRLAELENSLNKK